MLARFIQMVCIVLLLVQFVSPNSLFAYEEFVSFDGEVSQSWIAVSRDGVIDTMNADREKIEGGYLIRADVGLLAADALVSAIILGVDGLIISNPLHLSQNNELEQESIKLAQKKIPILENDILMVREKLKSLEGEMKLANIKKRKEFGFDEVDLIYERITVIQEVIKNTQVIKTP